MGWFEVNWVFSLETLSAVTARAMVESSEDPPGFHIWMRLLSHFVSQQEPLEQSGLIRHPLSKQPLTWLARASSQGILRVVKFLT